MLNFTDKVALVVGGAGYLCSPVCRQLAALGANVVIADLNEARAQELAWSLQNEGFQAHGIALNIGSEGDIQQGVSATVEAFGRLDLLVNATFGTTTKTVATVTGPEFDQAAHLQLTGGFLLARTAAEAMVEGGSIVMFSSMYGRISPDPTIYETPMNPNPIEYGVTKAGVDQMVRYLAVNYASRGIRVNGVAPGAFPHAGQNPDDPAVRAFVERLAKKAPMGRIGRQDELVGPTLFLLSDAASFVTGQVLPVDGGWTIW